TSTDQPAPNNPHRGFHTNQPPQSLKTKGQATDGCRMPPTQHQLQGLVPAGENPGRTPDAPGHHARSEGRSTASRAAVRGLMAPDEVRGPLWVGFGSGL